MQWTILNEIFNQFVITGSRGVDRGGLRGLQPSPIKKKEKKERGEKERKKEKREKRNQKRKEVEPVFQRTCGHGPLVAPRQPGSPETPDRNGAGISCLASAPLPQNPAYAPGVIECIS